MPTVAFNGSRQDLRRLLRQIPGIFAGTVADPHGVAKGLQLRLGVQLLSLIQTAFVEKSHGGMGSDGIQWPPLARSTIIGRRRSAGDKKAVRVSNRAKFLTDAEKKAVARKIEKEVRIRESHLRAKFGLTMAQARGLARANVEERYRQKLDLHGKAVYGTGKAGNLGFIGDILASREVDILRDTGELLRSFSPGIEDTPSGADGQVFKTPPGKVIVGTNKKPWHHLGGPNLPARHYWPPNGNLPAAWWQQLLAVGQRGVLRAVVLLVTGRAA